MTVVTTASNFFGGLELAKTSQNSKLDIITAKLPTEVILPLVQKHGIFTKPTVKIGDRVLTGQIIANSAGDLFDNPYCQALRSSISGVVVAIQDNKYIHSSNLKINSITIKSDGKDEHITGFGCGSDFTKFDSETLIKYIKDCGIIGLGGSGFPSNIKLSKLKNAHTIIVNGVECEPNISCDDALMQNRAQDIIIGTKILLHISNAKKAIIAIESGQTFALEKIKQANDDGRIEIAIMPNKYVSGYEKVLVKSLLNIAIPVDKHTVEMGVLCQNVGTVIAIYDAIINNKPLISRVITITGNVLEKQQNYLVRLGCDIASLLPKSINKQDIKDKKITITIGGHMMGINIKDANYPINKTTNCIFLNKKQQQPKEQACIRCGICHQACPIKLLPQQLYWYSRSKETEKALTNNLLECIECNCCTAVCPSNIPLTDYFRHAKAIHNKQEIEVKQSNIAKDRFEFRNYRLARNTVERKKIMAEKKAKIQQKMLVEKSQKDKIQQALQRVTNKKHNDNINK